MSFGLLCATLILISISLEGPLNRFLQNRHEQKMKQLEIEEIKANTEKKLLSEAFAE